MTPAGSVTLVVPPEQDALVPSVQQGGPFPVSAQFWPQKP